MASTSLSRTPSSTGNRRTFTLSTWCKIMSSSTGNFLGAGGSGDQNHIQIESERFQIRHYAGGNDIIVNTNALLRDPSGWYHVVCAVDTTQSTDTNRIKLYINGELQTLSDTTYPSQNYDWDFNVSGETMYISRRGHSGAYYFNGEMSHFAWVDGQQLTPSTFGETDSTSGIWKWKEITGVTWGTNGFYLKFENSANLGLDSSGQGNNFTLSGSGTRNIDNPSINYATWNPLEPTSNLTFSNTNNTLASGAGSKGVPTTLAVSSGKFYFENKLGSSAGNVVTGIAQDNSFTYVGSSSTSYGHWNGNIYNSGSTTSYGGTAANNDIVGIGLDLDNNKMYVSINGTWQNSANPSSGTGGHTINAGTYHFAASGDTSQSWSANFGNGYFGTTAITSAGSNGNGSLFEYDVPSGYYALNTKNINTYG